MNVEHVMTHDPWTVTEETDLDRAMALMDERGLRHLPVLRAGELVGIVSNRDLLEATGWVPAARRKAQTVHRIGQVMQSPVVRVRPDETVVTAALELGLRRIGALPVVDGARLVGILSERDLLRAWLETCRRETVPGGTDVPIHRVMTRELRTLEPGATLAEAVALCRAERVNHLPVVEDSKLVGFLSDRDLRRALGRDRPAGTPVIELGPAEIFTLTEEATLYEAARLMDERKVSGVPITARGPEPTSSPLVGLVTLSDVLAFCMETLREPDTAPPGAS